MTDGRMNVNQERLLCARAKQGDRAAAFALIDAHYRPLYQYLRRLCGSRQDAEDLTQDTFAKVWSSLASYRADFRFSTWIHTIGYRVYIDWRREQKSAGRLPDAWWHESDAGVDPYKEEADRQWAESLYEAVERLDEEKRLVVHLHYYQGLSLRETSQVLNVATSTVKYRLREVMKILRSEFEWKSG
jgi:RNA polymerase sigma-70 factor (ECF subfamily)